jgi:hypothetical protein
MAVLAVNRKKPPHRFQCEGFLSRAYGNLYFTPATMLMWQFAVPVSSIKAGP